VGGVRLKALRWVEKIKYEQDKAKIGKQFGFKGVDHSALVEPTIEVEEKWTPGGIIKVAKPSDITLLDITNT